MNQKSGPPPIVFIIAFLVLMGAGIWWFFLNKPAPTTTQQPTDSTITTGGTTTTIPQVFSPPSSVPKGTTIKIDGSTSMVTVNQNLKNAFEKKFPGTKVSATANGTEKGIQDLVAGKVDIAGASRPLTPQEQSQGLTVGTCEYRCDRHHCR